MTDLQTIDDLALTQTMRGIKREARLRGWKILTPYHQSPHCFINREDGRSIHIFSATPPTTSFAAAQLANDKLATYLLLKDAGIDQPATMLATKDTIVEEIELFLKNAKKVVVKPADGGHGIGITLGLRTVKDIQAAITFAIENSKVKRAILQAQYPAAGAKDIRILCIDAQYVAALERVPARVYGDGSHSIHDLIEMENLSSRRGEAYKSPLALIDIETATRYLGQKIYEVPKEGEEIRVMGVANYGAGGELVDVTDDIPMWLRESAQTASNKMNLPVAGVDFMISNLPHIDATADDLNSMLIEVNKCPSLAIHDAPNIGKSRHAVSQYMDYLARI